jgi:hypothetical protein
MSALTNEMNKLFDFLAFSICISFSSTADKRKLILKSGQRNNLRDDSLLCCYVRESWGVLLRLTWSRGQEIKKLASDIIDARTERGSYVTQRKVRCQGQGLITSNPDRGHNL